MGKIWEETTGQQASHTLPVLGPFLEAFRLQVFNCMKSYYPLSFPGSRCCETGEPVGCSLGRAPWLKASGQLKASWCPSLCLWTLEEGHLAKTGAIIGMGCPQEGVHFLVRWCSSHLKVNHILSTGEARSQSRKRREATYSPVTITSPQPGKGY